MSEKSKELSRLAKYEERERRQRMVNISAMVAGGIFMFATVIIALTGNFSTVLNVIGIEAVETAGVYIDCSQRKNKKNKYCQTTQNLSQTDKNWRSLRNGSKKSKSKRSQQTRGGAFSLTE